jgi:PAS domain S-box-containing protein
MGQAHRELTVRRLTADDPSFFLIRRALPATIAVTLLTGWARWYASHRGWIDETTGVAIMTVFAIAIFSALTASSARKLQARAVERRAIDRAALYRVVAENYPGGAIFLFDHELRYLLVEGPNLDVVGLDRTELEGRTIWEALDPETCTQIEPVYRAALAGHRTTFEMPYRDQDYVVTVTPVQDESGSITGGLVQTQDVTAQRNVEAQLRQSQKLEAIGQLAGGVAHDFNNLLTVITGYASLALTKLPQDAPIRHTLTAIAGAADSAAALTTQLLAFSRKQVLQPRLIDVGEVVEHVRPMLERLIEARISLRHTIADDAPLVFFDRGQLEQVLINLVINARDAIPGSGTISIEVSRAVLDVSYSEAHPEAEAGLHLVLSVSDTGHGMDEVTRSRIFEPFFTTKVAGEGTGLGLATVHGIVKQSGGNIWVYSEPEHGTTFKIYIPVAEAVREEPKLLDGVAREKTTTAAAHEAGSDLTALVVDDHLVVSQLTAEILETAGYTVLQAHSPSAAAEILARKGVDVILSDIVMPGGSGQAPAYPSDVREITAPVLYMSGYTAEFVSQRDLTVANARFLEKPFSPAALLGAVAAAVGRRDPDDTSQ